MRLCGLRAAIGFISAFAAAFGMTSAFGVTSAWSTEALPKLRTTLQATSVSGLSSGAYMAGQIEIAHAEDIVGAGIVAGGPFGCAESPLADAFPYWPTAVAQNGTRALLRCMKTTMGEPDPERLVARAKERAEKGEIDPLSALARHNVYLYSGDEDATVTRPVVEAAKRFYDLAGVPAGNVTLVKGDGGHAFITEEGGAACGLSEPPYVSDCDYDQARAILGWIYGPLEPSSKTPQGEMIVFSQSDFSDPGDGFADEGVVYVPASCREEPGCRVHIALHGCGQSREKIGNTFITESGFATIADSNRLVILFPQISASSYNPEGCWDWWGYTGLDFLSKNAAQISAIWTMVEHLAKQE